MTALAANRADGQALWAEVSALVSDKAWRLHGLHQESGHLDEVFREITQGAAA